MNSDEELVRVTQEAEDQEKFNESDDSELLEMSQQIEEHLNDVLAIENMPPLGPFSYISSDEEDARKERFHYAIDTNTADNYSRLDLQPVSQRFYCTSATAAAPVPSATAAVPVQDDRSQFDIAAPQRCDSSTATSTIDNTTRISNQTSEDHQPPQRLIDGTETGFDAKHGHLEDTGRFCFLTEDEIQQHTSKSFAMKTEQKIRWAAALFGKWKMARNVAAIDYPEWGMSPINVQLEHMTNDELSFALSRFILEVKKANQDPYPAKTLREIILSIQMYLETQDRFVKLLNDSAFVTLRNTLDNTMKKRTRCGIGVSRKQAEEISLAEEGKLWQKGILGDHSPNSLLNTIFYLNGVHFALRGGDEHRNLRDGPSSQITLHADINGLEYLEYREDYNKSNQGGLKHINVKQKVVRAYQNTENVNRSLITIYKKYMAACPDPRPNAFYLRPLSDSTNQESGVLFAKQPMGRHKLSQFVSKMCSDAGIPGYRTNHSLRATAASRLYQQGVDEQLIQEVTGHRSTAVRSYKRTSNDMQRDISDILAGATTDETSPSKIRITSPPFPSQIECDAYSPLKDETTSYTVRRNDSGIQLTININMTK